jgi:hypothetical protein
MMNTCNIIVRRILRNVFALLSAMLLLTGVGCGLVSNEEDGDKEPVQGEFRVTANPPGVTFTPSNTIALVNLSAVCGGDHPPAECNPSFDPSWESGDIGTLVGVFIINPHSLNTVAEIRFFANELGDINSLQGFHDYAPVVILPTQVPHGLTLTGQKRIDVRLAFPQSSEPRKEEAPLHPNFTAVPRAFKIRPGDSNPKTESITMVYKGTNTTLLDIHLDGPDADKFSFLAPTTPFAMDQKFAFAVNVTFSGTTNFGTHYRARLNVFAENGAYKFVDIDAFR